ncbi:hypothetical protein HYU45_03355 [Candidatus Daviesbacteria bacterium]|nr:hypothetical protein [Candidatus Daviesbacteria bacterium]
MKKLNLYQVLIVLFIALFLGSGQTYAQQQPLSYELQPNGPLNPGQTYTIKIVGNTDRGVPCKQCFVNASFQGDPQPLDSIEPAKNITDNNGIAYINVTSYVTVNREVLLDIQLAGGQEHKSQVVLLSYNNNLLLSVISLIRKVVDLGIPFPPMGNVYPQITHQRYEGGLTRTIYIKSNKPFGTKLFKISQFNSNGNAQLLRLTQDQEASVEISAFDDVNIGVQACSTSKGDDISCVGPSPLSATRITDPEAASKSVELQVPNKGLLDSGSPEERIKQEETQIDNNPFSRFFKSIFSSYK